MEDNPYGAYGASRSEPDWRANAGRGRVAEQFESYGNDHPDRPTNRFGEGRSFGPRERDEQARRYQNDAPPPPGSRDSGFGPREGRNANARYFAAPYPEYSGAVARPYDRAPYDRAFFDGAPSSGSDRGHRGKGPKGYRRSDARIVEDISERMMDDPSLDASGIDLRVHDGEVTLDGTVERREDKRRAEILAEECSGVDHVQNNLRVQRRERAETTNASEAYRDGLAGENPILDRVADGKSHLQAD